MTINDKEYGEFDVDLIDDGTLDTVLIVYHGEENHEVRFNRDDIRDESGAILPDAFAELAEEAVTDYIEKFLI